MFFGRWTDLTSTMEPPTSNGSRMPTVSMKLWNIGSSTTNRSKPTALQAPFRQLFDVVQQVPVGEHRAFGPTGGAGGVNDHRQVVLFLRGRGMGSDARGSTAKLFDLDHLQPQGRAVCKFVQIPPLRADSDDQHIDCPSSRMKVDFPRPKEVVDRHDDAWANQLANRALMNSGQFLPSHEPDSVAGAEVKLGPPGVALADPLGLVRMASA